MNVPMNNINSYDIDTFLNCHSEHSEESLKTRAFIEFALI
jgi:hypothetical protein